MNNVSVVIPAYGDRGLLDALLLRLDNYCSDSVDEIVIVDNGNHWKEAEHIGKERWVHLPQNIGFGPAVNCGAALAKGDILVIISTDVEFSEDVIGEAKTILDNGDSLIVGGKLWKTDTGWNKIGDILFPYIEGWFIAVWKTDWVEVGGISPEFYPYDYEDIDFSTKVLKREEWFLLGEDPNTFLRELKAPTLRHLGGRTLGYNPEREAVTQAHRKIFEEKWVK
jgi:GT2 family glycosyltransferase